MSDRLQQIAEDWQSLDGQIKDLEKQLADVKAAFAAEIKDYGPPYTYDAGDFTVALVEYERAPAFDDQRFRELVGDELFEVFCEPKGWQLRENEVKSAWVQQTYPGVVDAIRESLAEPKKVVSPTLRRKK